MIKVDQNKKCKHKYSAIVTNKADSNSTCECLIGISVRYKNNGGLNISKRENSKLWRAVFPNCAPVSLREQRILVKHVFIF